VLDDAALATDLRFERNSLRVEHSAELDAEVERAFAGSTAEEVAARLEHVGIANALLRDLGGLAAHPQLQARGRWADYGSPVGTLQALIPPATLEGTTPVMGPVPAVGQHTDAVLAELGLLPEPPHLVEHDPEGTP
jgi:crotonobetainyl-CoA:carnitine CoA-transferase CaiB-like acyl-CoA transferase